MTPETARAIDRALGDLSPIDRVASLVASIVTRKDADKAVLSMVALTTCMAKFLDAPARIAIAEILRDAADEVERRQLERV